MPGPKKDAQLTVRLPSDVKEGIAEAARQQDRSSAWLIITILREWLRKHPPKRKAD